MRDAIEVVKLLAPAILTGIVALITFKGQNEQFSSNIEQQEDHHKEQIRQFEKQIERTKRNLAVSYIAESRGQWINTTREYFSDYISSIRKVMDYERYYIFEYNKKESSIEKAREMTDLKSDNIRCRIILQTSFNINENQGLDKEIIDIMDNIEEIFNEYFESLKKSDDESFQKCVDKMDSETEILKTKVSEYFKNEWEKIKMELNT